MTEISVIIPTYNRAALVPKAIESVLAQTHAAAEIIVVDDGSKDNTREVLAAYGGRVRAIHQENSGLSGARNAGIEAARSEWVAFLDDDDEFTADRLEIAAESIRLHPDVIVHATNTALVLEGGSGENLFALRGYPLVEHMLLERPLEWILRGCFFAQTLVVRKSDLITVGLFRRTFYEDLDLTVRLAGLGSWVVDSRTSLHLIRRTGDDMNLSSQWRSRPVENFEALVRIHRDALRISRLSPSEVSMVRSGLATNLFELGVSLRMNGEVGRAQEAFREAASLFPRWRSRLKSVAALLSGKAGAKVFDRLRRSRERSLRSARSE